MEKQLLNEIKRISEMMGVNSSKLLLLEQPSPAIQFAKQLITDVGERATINAVKTTLRRDIERMLRDARTNHGNNWAGEVVPNLTDDEVRRIMNSTISSKFLDSLRRVRPEFTRANLIQYLNEDINRVLQAPSGDVMQEYLRIMQWIDGHWPVSHVLGAGALNDPILRNLDRLIVRQMRRAFNSELSRRAPQLYKDITSRYREIIQSRRLPGRGNYKPPPALAQRPVLAPKVFKVINAFNESVIAWRQGVDNQIDGIFESLQNWVDDIESKGFVDPDDALAYANDIEAKIMSLTPIPSPTNIFIPFGDRFNFIPGLNLPAPPKAPNVNAVYDDIESSLRESGVSEDTITQIMERLRKNQFWATNFDPNMTPDQLQSLSKAGELIHTTTGGRWWKEILAAKGYKAKLKAIFKRIWRHMMTGFNKTKSEWKEYFQKYGMFAGLSMTIGLMQVIGRVVMPIISGAAIGVVKSILLAFVEVKSWLPETLVGETVEINLMDEIGNAITESIKEEYALQINDPEKELGFDYVIPDFLDPLVNVAQGVVPIRTSADDYIHQFAQVLGGNYPPGFIGEWAKRLFKNVKQLASEEWKKLDIKNRMGEAGFKTFCNMNGLIYVAGTWNAQEKSGIATDNNAKQWKYVWCNKTPTFMSAEKGEKCEDISINPLPTALTKEEKIKIVEDFYAKYPCYYKNMYNKQIADPSKGDHKGVEVIDKNKFKIYYLDGTTGTGTKRVENGTVDYIYQDGYPFDCSEQYQEK